MQFETNLTGTFFMFLFWNDSLWRHSKEYWSPQLNTRFPERAAALGTANAAVAAAHPRAAATAVAVGKIAAVLGPAAGTPRYFGLEGTRGPPLLVRKEFKNVKQVCWQCR